MAKLPSFQFYPGDWMKDPQLRSVSYAARGLWTDMLCLMHESDRRGYLQLNGSPVSAEQLARMTGGSTNVVTRLLQELESSGVFSRTEHGLIYSRRIVRDEQIRRRRAEGGAKGGNPALMCETSTPSRELGVRKVNLAPNLAANLRVNLPPTPSSSSSSSEEETRARDRPESEEKTQTERGPPPSLPPPGDDGWKAIKPLVAAGLNANQAHKVVQVWHLPTDVILAEIAANKLGVGALMARLRTLAEVRSAERMGHIPAADPPAPDELVIETRRSRERARAIRLPYDPPESEVKR